MSSDSSNVDAAIVETLQGDATLAALLPDGVFIDVAPANKTRFVIVSQVIHEDHYALNDQAAFEQFLYLVKAVARDSSAGTPVKAAAVRINELLQFQPLTVTGYDHMLTRREERVRYTEVDSENPETRWQHRGGRYAVFVSPTE